jgi:membrane protease YdiL (CAAX protease family)
VGPRLFLAVQVVCVNLVLGSLAAPTVAALAGSDSLTAPLVVPTLLLAATTQTAGTLALVESEARSLLGARRADAESGPHLVKLFDFQLTATRLTWLLGIALACVAVMGGFGLLLAAAQPGDGLGAGPAAQSVIATAADASQDALALAAPLLLSECILTPLAEEIVFRGLLLGALADAALGPSADAADRQQLPWAKLAVPLALHSLAFAAYHAGAAPDTLVREGLLGCVLGVGWLASRRSLAAVWAAHGLYNGLALATLLL